MEPKRPADPEEGRPRPWERRGATRRDCLPHRGNWLVLLASLALVLAVSSLCLLATGLVAAPFGWAVGRAARQDLDCMAAGRMDPDGRAETREAMYLAQLALALGTVGALACGGLALTVLLPH